jgi:hypothetical protein
MVALSGLLQRDRIKLRRNHSASIYARSNSECLLARTDHELRALPAEVMWQPSDDVQVPPEGGWQANVGLHPAPTLAVLPSK